MLIIVIPVLALLDKLANGLIVLNKKILTTGSIPQELELLKLLKNSLLVPKDLLISLLVLLLLELLLIPVSFHII